MHLQLTVEHFQLTPEIKNQIDTKFQKGTNRLLTRFEPDIPAFLTLNRLSSGLYQSTFDLHLPGQKHIHAQNSHRLLVSSLVGLRQQVEKQIEKAVY